MWIESGDSTVSIDKTSKNKLFNVGAENPKKYIRKYRNSLSIMFFSLYNKFAV